MNKTTAFEVAEEIRRLVPGVRNGKLHALLYYCQMRSLHQTDITMFDESLEAWRHGPVVVDVWRADRYQTGWPTTKGLSSGVAQQVAEVCSELGSMCDFTLAALVRQEKPWIESWEGRGTNALAAPIATELLRANCDSTPVGSLQLDEFGLNPKLALAL